MIWTIKPDRAIWDKFTTNTMVQHIGIDDIEFGDDYVAATMPVDHRTVQPYGIVHGGATAALAETLGSVASQFIIPDPENGKVAGIELNISHLRMVNSGRVKGTARPIKLGRRLHIWEINIEDERGKPVSRARLTVMVIEN